MNKKGRRVGRGSKRENVKEEEMESGKRGGEKKRKEREKGEKVEQERRYREFG